VKTEVIKEFLVECDLAPRQSMASSGLSAAASIAANGGTVATRHAATVAAAAAANHTSHWTVVTTATAHLATADTAVDNRRSHQNFSTAPAPEATYAARLSSIDAAVANIGTRTPPHSVSNNNQPPLTPGHRWMIFQLVFVVC
jgi:hypothetical protein